MPLLVAFVAGWLSAGSAAETSPAPDDPRTGAADEQTVPDSVRLRRDVSYREGDSGAWKLDIAMPKDPVESPLPAVVFFHGGGWASGDKDFHVPQCVELAQEGFVAATVNYRLSGEAPFPAAVEDVKCAIRWLRAHAEEYHVDPQRIAAIGSSAGGHLTAMAALAGPDAALEGDGPYREYESAIQAAVVVCGPSDLSAMTSEENPRRKNDPAANPAARISAFLAGPEETLAARQSVASPITYVSASAPPMLILHGSDDQVVHPDQARKLASALIAAGAGDVSFCVIDGAPHAVFREAYDQVWPAAKGFLHRVLMRPNQPTGINP